jgi:DNA anti-recombination protein RmuC
MSEKKEEARIQPSVEKLRVAHPESSGGGQASASMLGGAGNLEKIKEILFGSQSREYEKRFVRLEDRMQKEISTLKDDSSKNFTTLENYMKKEFELLNERLAKEQNDRSTGDQKLMEELKSMSLAFENKILQLEEKFNKRSRELHEQILTQSRNLSDEIRQKHETVSELLDKEAQELRVDKVERADLSELLMEMAMRLSNKVDVNLNFSANDLLNE